MLQPLVKLLVLGAAFYLYDMQEHTARPDSSLEWEACIRDFNPQGYRFLIVRSPDALMSTAHWQQYLDSYSLQTTNVTPHLWRFRLYYKDVQKLLHAHRTPGYRAELTHKQQQALSEAEKLVRTLTRPDMDATTKAALLHDALVTTRSYSLEGAKNATDLLLSTSGTCEAFGRTLQLLYELAGVRCELVYGTVGDGARHCWNRAFIGGEWLHIDPAWNAAATTSPHAPSHRYFALPAIFFRTNHTWDGE